jgi:molybdate transport system substrate-binding protein
MEIILKPPLFRIAGTFFSLLIVAGVAARPQLAADQSVSITVSAAISLRSALDDIGSAYERAHPGFKVTFDYGGSGTLQHQVEQGAPIDLFISASPRQMNTLEAEGLIVTETRRNLIGNALVLIVPTSSRIVQNFQDLTRLEVNVVALGEPNTVPAGMYARQTLDHLGLLAAVEKKAVYAKDVRQVLTYVETGNADAGFVYRTDALSSLKARIIATASVDSHDPIVYSGAVVRNSRKAASARAFLEFVGSHQAFETFERYGFTPVENRAEKN